MTEPINKLLTSNRGRLLLSYVMQCAGVTLRNVFEDGDGVLPEDDVLAEFTKEERVEFGRLFASHLKIAFNGDQMDFQDLTLARFLSFLSWLVIQ